MRKTVYGSLRSHAKAPQEPSPDGFPPVSAQLLEALRARWPLRIPREDWTERRLWKEAGQQELIEQLEKIAAQQSVATHVVHRS